MTTRIANWLNSISMYRLMSISLTILLVSAIVLSFVGLLDYSPLALIASAGVFVLVVPLASIAIGRIIGVYSHHESSYITALILSFLFTPSVSTQWLLIASVIGIIAAASKYLVVYGGRHIFNPAALAAVVAGVTGIAFATWWVATPLLLPVTILFMLLIFYKTRMLAVGGIFLLVAATAIAGFLLLSGAPLQAIPSLLVSWPLFFFAGFMLTEPLTLPPRHWQQLLVATFVGVLFALPVDLGVVTITPALALVLGNLLAFAFRRQKHIALTLNEVIELTPSSKEFIFSPNRPLRFTPGQYIEITLPHHYGDMRGMRRIFSLTSAPEDSDARLGIKFYDRSSSFKQTLRDLPTDSVVHATQISGNFTLPKDPATPLLFIAGGIGITPFISHLRHLQSTGQKRDIVLIYAVRNREELAYTELLKKAGITILIATASGKHAASKYWKNIDEPYIDKINLKAYIPDIQQRHVYISGPPAMVKSITKRAKCALARRVKTDSFTGY